MALNKQGLTSGLEDIFEEDQPSGSITGTLIAKEIATYWGDGQSILGGSAISAPALAALTPGLISAFEGTKPSVSVTITLITTAISTGILALLFSGGKHGIGGVSSSVDSILKSGLEIALATEPNISRKQHAGLFADAVVAFTATAITYGTGISPDFAPPIGNIT